MQIFVNTNYDFIKWRWRALAVSVLFIAVGFTLMAVRGLNLGIDFAGGANIVLKFRETVPLNQLRAELRDATIQQYGRADEHSVLIRLPQQQGERDFAGEVVTALHQRLNGDQGPAKLDLNYQGRDSIAELLKASDPDKRGSVIDAHNHYYTVAASIIEKRSELGIFTSIAEVSSVPGVTSGTMQVLSENAYLGSFNLLNQETVGPQVGRELQRKALFAITLSALAMGLYITLRFDLKFGIAAIACTIHDVMIALAFLAMMHAEFSLNIVAALLLIIGYSINDTVVLYDRVRENARRARSKGSFAEQMNLAMNQTLARTVLTSGSTMLVLVSLILFGGEVINSFSWILLIGIIAGTFSTLTLVPATAMAWDQLVARRTGGGRARAESASSGALADAKAKRAKG